MAQAEQFHPAGNNEQIAKAEKQLDAWLANDQEVTAHDRLLIERMEHGILEGNLAKVQRALDTVPVSENLKELRAACDRVHRDLGLKVTPIARQGHAGLRIVTDQRRMIGMPYTENVLEVVARQPAIAYSHSSGGCFGRPSSSALDVITQTNLMRSKASNFVLDQL